MPLSITVQLLSVFVGRRFKVAEEEAELEEMCEVDRFVSLIKAEVLTQRAKA
jgi:hypothetical protein